MRKKYGKEMAELERRKDNVEVRWSKENGDEEKRSERREEKVHAADMIRSQ